MCLRKYTFVNALHFSDIIILIVVIIKNIVDMNGNKEFVQ